MRASLWPLGENIPQSRLFVAEDQNAADSRNASRLCLCTVTLEVVVFLTEVAVGRESSRWAGTGRK